MHRAMAGVAATSPTPETVIDDKNRRLTDKILTAFTFAYAAGERAVAETLRQALAQAVKGQPAELCQRRRESALRRADLWVAFVEARDMVLVLDFSGSMNDDSSIGSSLGTSATNTALDNMWAALILKVATSRRSLRICLEVNAAGCTWR